MVRVGINGYGTIGKRVADAVCEQPDMELVGVAKTSPDYVAQQAVNRNYELHVPADYMERFENTPIALAGTTEELVEKCDIIVDATPGGIGKKNKSLYERLDTPAIFQGAEDDDIVDQSFNARANYSEATDAQYTRVVSCNTTGLSRLITPLDDAFGIEKARITLIRRGGDPSQSSRGPIDDILPDPVTLPSHHGPDVNTIFPDLDIDTLGVKVPATHMHLHAVNFTFEEQPTVDEIRDLLSEESRLFLIPEWFEIDGAGKLLDLADDAGRPRGDIWENCIWEKSFTVEGNDFYCFQGIHQEADVVPENIDAIRAMNQMADQQESIELTNNTLGMGIK